MRNRLTAIGLGAALLLGLGAPAVQAGSKGKRNTAIALAGVAAYGVVKKKPVIAAAAGAGAIYSYMRSREDRKKELRRKSRRHRSRRLARRRSSSYSSYSNRYAYSHPGASNGRKVGWRGAPLPPGQMKKR